MSTKHITDANFESDIVQAKTLALLDCGANWCLPCKKLHPIMEEIASEYDGRVLIGEADISEAPTMAQKFRIKSVPQILIFKDGKHIDTIYGLVPKVKIIEVIEKHI